MAIKNVHFGMAAALLWAMLGLTQAQAEMGKAPQGATDFYVSAFGGYVYQDGPEVNAYATAMSTIFHAFAVQDGGLVGVDLGFILGPDVSPFGLENARIESSFSTNIFDDDKENRNGARLMSVDGIFPRFGPGQPAGATQKREVYDGTIALKGEVGQSEVVDLTGALEFFVRRSEDKSRHFILGGGTWRSASVDTWYFGTMVAIQPEFQFGNGLSFATDFAAGVYVLDADGKFADNFGFGAVPSVSDSRTNVGFRGRLGGALKAAVASGVTASVFGVVDYWSDTAFADMGTGALVFDPSKVGLDGLSEAKVGARVTIALGGN
ncbi:MAG: hypothetical protein GY948_23870 [Alphaproteobacteria bacterium]|nr:hypothetical protein [Alphaproteobacteria bacterium]